MSERLQAMPRGILATLVVCAVSSLQVSAPVYAQSNEALVEAERLTTSMVESAKFTVIHMNRAASASSLATAQEEATLSRKSGQEMVSLGRQAIAKLEQMLVSSELPPDVALQGEQAVCYLRESIRHVHHWVQHTHHIMMSDSFRGGIAHVLDGARHARASGNSLLIGQSYLTLLVQADLKAAPAPGEARVVKGLPFCGFGEEAHHDREIFLDSPDEAAERHH